MPNDEIIKELKDENKRLQRMICFYQSRSEERVAGLKVAVDSCPVKNPDCPGKNFLRKIESRD